MFETNKQSKEFGFWKFEFVSDWSEADASPDIRISDLFLLLYQPHLVQRLARWHHGINILLRID